MKKYFDRPPSTMGDWLVLAAGTALLFAAVARLPAVLMALGGLLALLAPLRLAPQGRLGWEPLLPPLHILKINLVNIPCGRKVYLPVPCRKVFPLHFETAPPFTNTSAHHEIQGRTSAFRR